MLNILRQELINIINNIDSGNSNLSEEDESELIFFLRRLTSNQMSLDQSANYLGVCEKTFRNYIKNGWISEGIKEPGKPKYWLKSDLDKWKQEIKKKI